MAYLFLKHKKTTQIYKKTAHYTKKKKQRIPVILHPGEALYDVINTFQESRTHFALVTEQKELAIKHFVKRKPIPFDTIRFEGVITLEL